LEKKQVLNFENRYRAKDGQYKLLSWKSAPVGDLMYAAARDITASRQAETELRRTKDQLLAANRELEAFSYTAAHDLRAPLRSMSGFVNIVLEDTESKLSEDAKHCMGRVAAASKKMGQLIDALLNLSHISRRQIVPVPVNLSAIAHEVSKELRKSQTGRLAEFEIDDGLQVSGDPQLLKSAVANLLGNAWKYTCKLETAARIRFSRESVNGQSCFVVRDNGVGFDMKHASKLFGVFQRLHSPAEFDGIGVGLASTQRIINAHGGRIWADSEPGKGAAFYFTL
jgi:light-regulated signal transduction histidine kinase (bacteriophytochrome)